jgi:hypothetical protein
VSSTLSVVMSFKQPIFGSLQNKSVENEYGSVLPRDFLKL